MCGWSRDNECLADDNPCRAGNICDTIIFLRDIRSTGCPGALGETAEIYPTGSVQRNRVPRTAHARWAVGYLLGKCAFIGWDTGSPGCLANSEYCVYDPGGHAVIMVIAMANVVLIEG